MARELNIRITADNADAQAKLGQTERAIGGVTSAADKATSTQKAHADSIGAAVLKYNLIEKGVRLVTDSLTSGARAAAEQASTYQDLANKTGLSLQALQLYNVIAKESGSSVENYANAIFRLGANIEKVKKPTDAVAQGISELGLSFDAVRAMRPEQQFETIASALSKQESAQERNRLGILLFGRTYGEIAKGVDMDVAKVRDQIVFSSDAQIQALDRMGDMFSRWGTQISTLFQQQLGQMWIDLENFVSLAPRAFNDLQLIIPKAIASVVASIAGIGLAAKQMATDSVLYAMKTYEGIKLWLVDKFVSVVDNIKGKVDSVSNFFKDMYKKVVGGSYVPDMVLEIGQWIQRLDGLMVQPIEHQTRMATDSFSRMQQTVSAKFQEWGDGLGGWIQGKLPGILGGGLGAVTSGLMKSFGGILTGGLSSLVQMGTQMVWKGLSALGGAVASAFGHNATKGGREDFAKDLGFKSAAGLYDYLRSFGPEGDRLAHIALNVIGKNDKAGNQLWMQEVSKFISSKGFSAFDQRFGSGGTAAPGGFGGAVSGLDAGFGSGSLTGWEPQAPVRGDDLARRIGEEVRIALMNALPRSVEVTSTLEGRQVAYGIAPFMRDAEAYYGAS
jgi:hypothetical protein